MLVVFLHLFLADLELALLIFLGGLLLLQLFGSQEGLALQGTTGFFGRFGGDLLLAFEVDGRRLEAHVGQVDFMGAHFLGLHQLAVELRHN